MISCEKLSYSLPDRFLYRDASFALEDGRHCALIGANGTGKTTLINIILHPEDHLFTGKVKKENIEREGYVNQFVEREKDRRVTVFSYLCEDFERMQSEMDALCERLDTDEDMERYQQAMDRFEAIDGYNYEVNIRRDLLTAGLEKQEDVELSAISGGEYKLVQIIRQMLRLPDILVMDEPDVFLDFDNLKGLRDLINTYPGTILAATHNRYLLNHCFDKILQIENTAVQEFDGGYIEFCFTQLRMKIAMQELSKKEADFIEFEEAVVERLRDDATKHACLKKGKTLRARVSYVERWKARHTEEPYVETHMPEIHFPDCTGESCPDYAVRADNYSVAFDEPLLQNVSFELLPGEKAALVGPNGTGKTTLLRDIRRGNDRISVHPDMKVSFLSQFHGETADESGTVWQLMESKGIERREDAAEYLSGYCFDREALDKKLSVLSGGERNLLQLAVICLGDSDLLLLDEPSSHLDLPAQAALEKAINEYRGTVLMVSHDFYTVANTMDYVLYAEGGTIRRMSGRAFRRMIYKRHFPQNYLELEQKKKELEMQINFLLRSKDYEGARAVCEKLDEVISGMES